MIPVSAAVVLTCLVVCSVASGGTATVPPTFNDITAVPTLLPNPPTSSPSMFIPTNSPTIPATDSPTSKPSNIPTASLTQTPTATPSTKPTRLPTRPPTRSPTVFPTAPPTSVPSLSPSPLMTVFPSDAPTPATTSPPSTTPTVLPTPVLTQAPSPQIIDHDAVVRITMDENMLQNMSYSDFLSTFSTQVGDGLEISPERIQMTSFEIIISQSTTIITFKILASTTFGEWSSEALFAELHIQLQDPLSRLRTDNFFSSISTDSAVCLSGCTDSPTTSQPQNPTPTLPGTDPDLGSSGGLGLGPTIGIALSSSIVLIGVCVGIFFYIRWRNKHAEEQYTQMMQDVDLSQRAGVDTSDFEL